MRSILPCLLITLSYLSSSGLFLKNRATASEASSLLLTGCPLLLLHFQENSTQLLRMSLNLNSPCLFLTFCLHFYIPPFTKASSHKPGWGGQILIYVGPLLEKLEKKINLAYKLFCITSKHQLEIGCGSIITELVSGPQRDALVVKCVKT